MQIIWNTEFWTMCLNLSVTTDEEREVVIYMTDCGRGCEEGVIYVFNLLILWIDMEKNGCSMLQHKKSDKSCCFFLVKHACAFCSFSSGCRNVVWLCAFENTIEMIDELENL